MMLWKKSVRESRVDCSRVMVLLGRKADYSRVMVLVRRKVVCSRIMVLIREWRVNQKTQDEQMEDKGVEYRQMSGVDERNHAAF